MKQVLELFDQSEPGSWRINFHGQLVSCVKDAEMQSVRHLLQDTYQNLQRY